MPKLRHTLVLVVAITAMAVLQVRHDAHLQLIRGFFRLKLYVNLQLQLVPGLNSALNLFMLTRLIDIVKVSLVVGGCYSLN